MISVIVPAHNEATVIQRCLTTVLRDSHPDELEIVVVCNGCSDNTAELARSFGPPVRVIETDIASKTNALNLGDTAATAFPRFYVDADVTMSIGAVRKTAAALLVAGILAAAPPPTFDLTGCSWAVRAFYRVWTSMPYFDAGMLGSGVFAVSRAGRARFGRFPNIIADDGFARLSFTPRERLTVPDCTFTVYPPKTINSVVRIKTRVRLGNTQLRRSFPELLQNETASPGRSLVRVAGSPRLWLASIVYFPVMLLSAAGSRRLSARGTPVPWARDASSRHA